jgi:hypothetical protein
MFSSGRLFLIGFVVFLGGLILPFIISFFMGLFHMDEDTRYHALRFLYYTGTGLALLVGVPLIVTAIIMRLVKRSRAGSPSV